MNQVCVALDLETTGLDQDSDEIIEIGAVKFQGNRVLQRWSTFVKPRRSIPLRTQKLTGIREEDVRNAPIFSAVAGRLVAFVGSHPIVGQSVDRDLAFLERAGLRFTNPVLDTFELASLLLPDLPEYSLAAIVRALNVPVAQHHRALADAESAKDVFFALWQRATSLAPSILAEINRLARDLEWPPKLFFQEAERTRAQQAFTNSIAAQLTSKMSLDELNVDFLVRGGRREGSLEPKQDGAKIEPNAVARLFSESGPVASVVNPFEARGEQLEMAKAVASALDEGEHLLVEAGTGTGKSLAYLIPAALFGALNGRRVVVSTNTINLQEQLIDKDLPTVSSVLAKVRPADVLGGGSDRPLTDFRSAVLKGRSNYLCLRHWSELRKLGATNVDELKVLIRILVWLPSTRTGDRTELNLMPGEQDVWTRVAARDDNCAGTNCSFFKRGTCFLYRARWAAEAAHVVVVNHALLLSDLKAGNTVIPDFSHLIIDEAHHLEDEATKQLGFEVSQRGALLPLAQLSDQSGDRTSGLLRELTPRFRGSTVSSRVRQDVLTLAQSVAERVDACRTVSVRELFDVITRFVHQHQKGSADSESRIRLTRAVRVQPGWSEVEVATERFVGQLRSLADDVGRVYAALESLAENRVIDLEQVLAQLSVQVNALSELGRRLTEALVAPDERNVYWLARSGEGVSTQICAAPLQPGEVLDRELFSKKQSVVLTSATLTTRGDFRYLQTQTGLSDARELMLGSPFNYRTCARMYVANDLPEPNRPGHQQAVERFLADFCARAQGRTLVLFTSRSAIRQTHAAIRPKLERDGIVVLGHGIDGSRRQLLSAFQNNDRTVLLGTSSFWEGVDVIGEALSYVVIAKLPFSVPTDPVFAARSETFDDAFNEYAVPQAILRFKQGFGRLIRSSTDRGAIIVLDPRVETKTYGRAFRESLPPCDVMLLPAQRIAEDAMAWVHSFADPKAEYHRPAAITSRPG